MGEDQHTRRALQEPKRAEMEKPFLAEDMVNRLERIEDESVSLDSVTTRPRASGGRVTALCSPAPQPVTRVSASIASLRTQPPVSP